MLAKFDKHLVNSGTVQLQDPETKSVVRYGVVGDDGTFKLSYVPEGNYLLKVTAAANTDQKSDDAFGAFDFGRPGNIKTIRNYGPAEMPLLVSGDVNGITLQVPDQEH